MLRHKGKIKEFINVISFSFLFSLLLSSCSAPQILPQSTSVLAHSLDIKEILLDEDNIYLITKVDKKIDNKNVESNRIQRIPKSGGTVKTLVEEKLEYFDLILDDEYLYWIAVNPTNSKSKTQYIKKVRKTGGNATIIYQEDALFKRSMIQDSNNIFILMQPDFTPGASKIVQIKKADSSIFAISENQGNIANIVLHKEYLYWSTCYAGNMQGETSGNIFKKIIEGEKKETIISDDCYGLSYETNQGIYWLGSTLILLNETSGNIELIIDREALERGREGANAPEGKQISAYFSKIIFVDSNNIYFSQVYSALSGFASCTDMSETVLKYSFLEKRFKDISIIRGEIDNFYRMDKHVYIFGKCNSYDYQVLHLGDDKIEEVSLGGIKKFAVDNTRIYWTNSEGVLLTRSRDMQ